MVRLLVYVMVLLVEQMRLVRIGTDYVIVITVMSVILIPVAPIRVPELDVGQMRVVLKGRVLVIPVIPAILIPVVLFLVQEL